MLYHSPAHKWLTGLECWYFVGIGVGLAVNMKLDSQCNRISPDKTEPNLWLVELGEELLELEQFVFSIF